MSKIDVKKYRYQEKSKTPPSTIRYCTVCAKKTTWIFNPQIGHSQCEECGYRKVSDTLINYQGKIMEKANEHKDNKGNKNYRRTSTYAQSYLSKFLNKKVKCTLLNSDIIEGTFVCINPYEITVLVEDEEVIIFKHGILVIKECK